MVFNVHDSATGKDSEASNRARAAASRDETGNIDNTRLTLVLRENELSKNGRVTPRNHSNEGNLGKGAQCRQLPGT